MQRKSKIFPSPDGKIPDLQRFASEGLGHDGLTLKELSDEELFSWAFDLVDFIYENKYTNKPLLIRELNQQKFLLTLIKKEYNKRITKIN